jgi:lipid-A-disaccharide synthase-like uncharacterized protein
MRFVWQWIVSERRGESVIPIAFWYFSLVGGSMLTFYAVFRDVVVAPCQAAGLVVYIRNLALIHRAERTRLIARTFQHQADDTDVRQAA